MRISQHRAAQPYLGVLQKTASPTFDAAMRLGKTVAEVGAVAVPLATLAVTGASAVYSKLTEASRKAGIYKQMMDQNPHLHAQDPDLVQRYFNTIYRFNPELAQDPTVAASFVNNMVSMNRADMPHAPIYDQALKMTQGRRGGAEGPGFGQRAGELLGGIAKDIRADRTEQLKGMMSDKDTLHRYEMQDMQDKLRGAQSGAREQQQRNEVLKRYAIKMRGQARGGYGP